MSMSFGFMVAIGVVVWILESIIKCLGAGHKSCDSSAIAANDWHQQEIFRQQMEQDSMIANEFMQQQQMESDRFMQEMQQQQMESDRFMQEMQQQQFMDFSEKSVTPFEMGGFNMDFGNSFNDFGGGFFDSFGGGFDNFGGGMF